jgi:hypothetical protein
LGVVVDEYNALRFRRVERPVERENERKNHSTVDGTITEHLQDYVSASDFAYVPVIIAIYGQKELETVGEKRVRGRVKGQSGMTCKQNISLYIASLIRMKAILEDEENRANVIDWSNAIFNHIESQNVIQPPGPSEAMLDRILAAEQAKKDIRKMKKMKF